MIKSNLVSYTRVTRHRTSPRNHVIDTITIHCYVGQATAKQGCDYFAETDRQCSANYVIGYDGSTGCSVPEEDRSWCSSSAANDHRAVTIEVASDMKPPYAVTNEAYNALIDLVTDICKRNKIKKLMWQGNKALIGQVDKQNMTVHRWFNTIKDCPGDYLYNKHGDIAKEVNRRLGVIEFPAQRPDTYTANGLTFIRAKNFAVKYHDAVKKSAWYSRYINAGFFGNYKDANGKIFTLPVANLMCDCDITKVCQSAQKYITPHVNGGKLCYDISDNASAQFKGKSVATLIVPQSGKPYIADVTGIPSDAKYAISGVPTVRHGDDVNYYNYVKRQGWDESCMYATYRNWIGIRNGEIWIITGRTYDKNYIYGMEIWKKIQAEKFDDVICLDGGGSYLFKNGGTIKKTAENRRINSIITF